MFKYPKKSNIKNETKIHLLQYKMYPKCFYIKCVFSLFYDSSDPAYISYFKEALSKTLHYTFPPSIKSFNIDNIKDDMDLEYLAIANALSFEVDSILLKPSQPLLQVNPLWLFTYKEYVIKNEITLAALKTLKSIKNNKLKLISTRDLDIEKYILYSLECLEMFWD